MVKNIVKVNSTQNNFYSTKKRGFTLIETMIAMAIFIFVVTIGMGALLNVSLIHEKSQDMRSVMDNLSFIMEDMSRNLRTGYNYHCGNISGAETLQNCTPPNGGGVASSVIFFKPATIASSDANPFDLWGYEIVLDANGTTYDIDKTTNGGQSWVSLNPEAIQIDPTHSGFSVVGTLPPSGSNNQQPFVTIRLVGTVTYQGVSNSFSIQTSVSQRLLNQPSS
jgi:prepilin-type N-terminal cleavage/methylation domain-containing protein